jgi:tRNA pseudouridine55 synthase
VSASSRERSRGGDSRGRRERAPRDGGLDGILVVDKPAGPTSHDVVALVRRLAATRRVGHGGTLDPFASGVLPLFLGTATRFVEYHLGDRKGYRATVCFGATSTTDDLEGELTPAANAPDRDAVEHALDGFVGTVEQRPPAYSALKVAGRRAYALARAGETVELSPRTVTIDEIALLEWDDTDAARPIAIIDVQCSAGTYVRALARDLGEAVGSGAYLGALVRTASGPFTLDQAQPLEAVRGAAAAGPDGLRGVLLPLDAGLDELPEVTLDARGVEAVARGQYVRLPVVPAGMRDAPVVRVRDGAGRLVAIGSLRDGRIAPDKVLIPAAAGDGLSARTVEAAEGGAESRTPPRPNRRRPPLSPELAYASEADPPEGVDPDYASPDDA